MTEARAIGVQRQIGRKRSSVLFATAIASVFCLLFLASCAPGQTVPVRIAAGPVDYPPPHPPELPKDSSPLRELPVQSAALMAQAVDRYDPSGREEIVARLLPGSQRLADQYLAALPETERPFVAHNPMLDLVAYVYAAGYAEKERLPASTLSTWLFWKFGITSVQSGSYAIWASGTRANEDVEQKLREHAGMTKAGGKPIEFGVASIGTWARTGLAVVTADRNVEISDLPKKHKPGDTLTLRGRIVAPHDRPVLYFDKAGGVGRKEIVTDAAGGFTVTFPLPDKPGRYFMEVTARDPAAKGQEYSKRWRRKLMLVPIYVSEDEPAKPDEMIAHPPPNPPDRNLWAQRILDLYNAERKTGGLAPLALSVEASAHASERSAKFASDDRTPPESTLGDELARRGLLARRWYQLAAGFDSVNESVWHALLSPMHRKAILSKNAALVGIGISKTDEQRYAAVQYIITPVPALDAKAKKKAIFDAVNALRAAKGKPAFKASAAAQTAVDEFANGVCTGKVPYGKVEPLYALLKKKKVRYANARTLSVRTPYFSKNDVKKKGYEALVETDKGTLSIGICRSDLPDLPGGEIVVFLVLTGARRKAPTQ